MSSNPTPSSRPETAGAKESEEKAQVGGKDGAAPRPGFLTGKGLGVVPTDGAGDGPTGSATAAPDQRARPADAGAARAPRQNDDPQGDGQPAQGRPGQDRPVLGQRANAQGTNQGGNAQRPNAQGAAGQGPNTARAKAQAANPRVTTAQTLRPHTANQQRPNQPGANPQRPNQPGARGAAGNGVVPLPRPAAPAKPPAPGLASVPQHPVPPPARPARLARRHLMLGLSLLLWVVLPVLATAFYLWFRAADQYASYVGFSVRSESAPAPSELLGGLGSLIGVSDSSTSDTDILYKFIQSHDLVAGVNERLDLRAVWSKPENDPVFSYRGGASLEDLLDEWEDKVRVYYDDGMIDLRILAFDPQDAQAIAQAVLDESLAMINDLNDVAREDTIRFSREELDRAVERLKQARQAMTAFRNQHQLVDPTSDVQGQAGILALLQQQLAEALIAQGMLKSNAQQNDPRVEQSELRIATIREQIEDERRKFGSETSGGEKLSNVVGQYEGLVVDRQFAEQTYTASLAAFDTAQAEARRQSRYLAPYVRPTLAQKAEYPERSKLLGIIAGFLTLSWMIAVLVFYSLRDRR